MAPRLQYAWNVPSISSTMRQDDGERDEMGTIGKQDVLSKSRVASRSCEEPAMLRSVVPQIGEAVHFA